MLNNWSQAIDYFLALPNHKDLAKFRISPDAWDSLQDVEVVLSVSYTSTVSNKSLI
jgi:hypothetical protein